MINKRKLMEAAELAKRLPGIHREIGAFGWNPHALEIQMNLESLLKAFPDAEFTHDPEWEYCWTASAEEYGVRWFALATQEEYDALGRD